MHPADLDEPRRGRSPVVFDTAARHGLVPIDWDVDPRDWEPDPAPLLEQETDG